MTALRHFFGRLHRRPMYAATALLTLALGVGACVALFAVVYGVLLKPLPYEKPDGRTSFTLTMLSLSAGMALLLGSVGIYGVLSFLVVERTREIGVRLALGAQRASVSRMMIRHGMVLTAVGVAVGLAAAAAVTRVLESLLFGVEAIDPTTYVGASLGLAAVALVAGGVASLRAASVDPIEALRAE